MEIGVDQQRRLHGLAKREQRPQTALIREAIDQYLARCDERALPSWVGMISTDRLDSAKVGEHREEWIGDVLRRKDDG